MKDLSQLSFLDLLTCAFGGMLLLFTIMIAEKESLSFDIDSESRMDAQPFLMAVELDDLGNEDLEWEVSDKDFDTVAKKEFAEGLALFMAPSFPEKDCRIYLQGISSGGMVVRYFDSNLTEPRRINYMGSKRLLWPPEEVK